MHLNENYLLCVCDYDTKLKQYDNKHYAEKKRKKRKQMTPDVSHIRDIIGRSYVKNNSQ